MIDHTGMAVRSFDDARAFYDRALAPLGASLLMMVPPEHTGGVKVAGYGRDGKPSFWLHETGHNDTVHIAFATRSRAEVHAFWDAATAAGGKDNGPPGLRPHFHPGYYAAFVLDPDGNNIEAVCHAPQ
jgi:catechol 2,3-dioxygenase-like lactoylglutathione lyase family enzyme